MSVSLNPNVQWDSIVSKALQGSDLEGMSVTQATQTAEGNLSITLTAANGESQVVVIDPPVLDAENGMLLSEEGLEALQKKLDDSFADLKAALKEAESLAQNQSAGTTSSHKALFDIYSLMRIMIEVSKQQRQAARQTRDAELVRTVADVKHRAEIMRSTALTSLGMSIAFSLASIAAQAASMAGSVKAQVKAMKIETASGITAARQDLALLSAKNPKESSANLTRIEKSITDPQKALGDQKLQDAASSKAVLDKANANLTDAQDELNAADPSDPDAIAAAQARVDSATSEVEAAKGQYAADLDKCMQDIDTQLDAKRVELATAEGQLEVMKSKAEDTKKPLTPKEKQDMADLETNISSLKGQVKDLTAARQYMRATCVNEKMKNGMIGSLSNDTASAKAKLDHEVELLNANEEYRDANLMAQRFASISDIAKQTGDMLTSLSQNLNSMRQAEATEYEAAEKTDQSAYDESNDLVASAQQLLQSVLDLLKAVQSAENQSIQRIMA